MNADDIKLAAVNWEHGMLLTPDHFLRQERYLDSALLWIVRYCTNAYGLIGGGPRLTEAERGAVRNDPIVVVTEDAESLSISITQCRALTPAGCMIEVNSSNALHRTFSKGELEGIAETMIYVVFDPHAKEPVDGETDPFNPQMKTERLPAYRIALKVPADTVPYSVVISRLQRQKYGAGYERDSAFIPACTSLCSHSELIAAWRRIVDQVNALAQRYTALHQAMREFLILFKERGIETEVDAETMRFVDRMVTALQDCGYAIYDPVQSPQNFFVALQRFFHTAAVYLELTPAVQQYFDILKETGETEFIAPLEQQKQLLNAAPRWEMQADLGIEVRSSVQRLEILQRLERALEGKYIDFRLSPSLESMNFIFDRGGKVLYRLAAKPARVQGVADELLIFFSQLHLEGRDKYRLILTAEDGAQFEKGSKITAEIRLNEGSGFRRQPIILSCEVKSAEQRNFEFDFEAPDVPTISDMKVSLQSHCPVRTALLFIRHRFYGARAYEPPQQVEAVEAEYAAKAAVPVPAAPPGKGQPAAPRGEPRVQPAETTPDPARAPWENPPTPPRRRRLE